MSRDARITVRSSAVLGLLALSCPAESAAIEFAIEEEEVVGRRGVGLACFPPTPIRWDRQYRPAQEDLAALTAEAFGDLDAPSLAGEVLGIRLTLCQPHWGPLAKWVGRPTALKGPVAIEVRWSDNGKPLCSPMLDKQPLRTETEITTHMRGGIVGVVERALLVNAQEAARRLRSAGPCAPDRPPPHAR